MFFCLLDHHQLYPWYDRKSSIGNFGKFEKMYVFRASSWREKGERREDKVR